MNHNTDSTTHINILAPKGNGLVEIKVPIEILKLELEKLLQQLQTITRSEEHLRSSFQIEELEFDLALTEEGQLAFLSTYLTDRHIKHVIKLRVKRVGDTLDVFPHKSRTQQTTSSPISTSQVRTELVRPAQSGNYKIPATSKTPALIIFLLDVSASMSQAFDEKSTRIEALNSILMRIAVKMVQRSTKGTVVTPRYRVGMFAYSSQIIDLLDGIRPIDELAKMGVPKLTTLDMSDTAAAFSEVENLLQSEMPNIQDCPPPLIYHITDGEDNGTDPTPIAHRIMEMSTKDGNVLIANVMLDGTLVNSDADSAKWAGFQSETDFASGHNTYLLALFNISSRIPESYCSTLKEFGYSLRANSRMLFPASMPELIEVTFAPGGATPVTKAE